METKVSATLSEDMMSINVVVESKCKHVQSIGEIKGLNPYEVIGIPFVDNPVYKRCSECLPHAACPVPCAIIKCIEAASGLALKKPVSLEWEN